jgi:carboxymethylenebutenolidase
MRQLAIALSLLLSSAMAVAADLSVRELGFQGRDGEVRVRCYSEAGAGPLPVVVLLHGAAGFGPYARHYESHAEALARHQLRTCAVLYYSAKDARIIAGPNGVERSTLFQKRFMAWHAVISDAVDRLSKPDITERGNIGLLGFSQGGYLAIGVAGTNPRVKAVAEFYGGFPGPLEGRITKLPPTLILHGEADTVIPVQEAHALEAMARQRATSHVMKLYPGGGHGFDLRQDDPHAIDARKQTVDFFVRHLPRVRQ